MSATRAVGIEVRRLVSVGNKMALTGKGSTIRFLGRDIDDRHQAVLRLAQPCQVAAKPDT